MSLDIRYVTNGEKKFYRVIDSSAETFNIYETLDQVPKNIRHYAESEKLKFCGPDLARIYGVLDILYPGFPNCGLEEYTDRKCIAESCKYAAEEPNGWEKCPYFDKEYLNE